MKRLFLFIGVMAIIASYTNAQQKPQKISRDEISKLHARNIATTLAFDDTTREKFIDTYCKYQADVRAIHASNRKPVKDSTAMTDQDIEAGIKARFAFSRKLLDLREAYYANYREFLSPRQIQRVYEMEKNIGKRMMRNHQLNKQGNKHRAPKTPNRE